MLTRSLAPGALDSWGWRIPFLFGLIIGPLGLYIRRNLDETSAFLQSSRSAAGQTGSGTVLASHVKEMLACMGMVVSGTISFYVVLVYIPTFARTQLHLPLDQAFLGQSIGLACEVVLIPIFGVLSDLVGRKPMMIAALLLDFAVTYPLFSWVGASPSFGALLTMQVVLCSLFGVFNGPVSTALAEQFPTRVRSTALAISYNIAVMLFGGFAQFFVTWLIEATGTPIAPAYYLMFGAAVGCWRLCSSGSAPATQNFRSRTSSNQPPHSAGRPDIADRRKSPAGELLGSIILNAAGVAARPTLLDRWIAPFLPTQFLFGSTSEFNANMLLRLNFTPCWHRFRSNTRTNLARCLAGPTFERVRERTDFPITEQPRDLRNR